LSYFGEKQNLFGRDEEAERTPPPLMISNYPVATIKLKPTSFPKFTGNKCDFHRRKRDASEGKKGGKKKRFRC